MTKIYEITDKNDDLGMAVIRLTETKFAGTEFSFGKISLGEEDENGQIKLSFEYNVSTSAGFENKNDEFENIIGDILTELMTESLVTKINDENIECKE